MTREQAQAVHEALQRALRELEAMGWPFRYERKRKPRTRGYSREKGRRAI